MSKTIKVIVTVTGEVKIEALGFKGSTCQEATKFLESLGDFKDIKKKVEYYQSQDKYIYNYVEEK